MAITFYSLAFLALIISFAKSREKTKIALKKSWKSFENILPQLSAIILIIGLLLALVSPEQISGLLGSDTGWYGTLLAALIGSIVLMPAFVAFPLAAALLHNGAGYMQIAALVSTLMMVGIITIPLEASYFGRKATLLRNALALGCSLLVAAIMGVLLL